MFEKYKKPESFYKAYDLISEAPPFRDLLFSFLRGKFKDITSKETAHVEIIKSFVEYFYTTIFEGNPLAELLVKQYGPVYHEIFSYCYEEKFGTKPGEKYDIMRKLSIPASRNIFENVENVKSSIEKINQEDFESIKNQFIFIREFSKFIHAYKDKEPLNFFKRFLNDFDFDSEGLVSTQNTEWLKEHEAKFEIIKLDNQADDGDFSETRKWYEEQLYKVDFNALSEKDKASFILEMFVAFGNISNPDTGGPEGFIRPLKDTFFLGRYYNIHTLSLQYVNWTAKLHPENKKNLKDLAYETKRKLCGQGPVPPQKIKEAFDAGLGSIALEPGGQKARRTDLSRIKTQEPIPAFYDAFSGMKGNFDKLIKNISMYEASQAKDKQTALNCAFDVFKRFGRPISIRDEDKENVLNVAKRLKDSKFPQDFAGSLSNISTSKSSFGLVTHYEKHLAGVFLSNPKNLNPEDVVEHLLKN